MIDQSPAFSVRPLKCISDIFQRHSRKNSNRTIPLQVEQYCWNFGVIGGYGFNKRRFYNLVQFSTSTYIKTLQFKNNHNIQFNRKGGSESFRSPVTIVLLDLSITSLIISFNSVQYQGAKIRKGVRLWPNYNNAYKYRISIRTVFLYLYLCIAKFNRTFAQ